MKISRRDFLKGSAAGALSLAATSLIGPATAVADEAAEPVNVYKTVAATMNPQDYTLAEQFATEKCGKYGWDLVPTKTECIHTDEIIQVEPAEYTHDCFWNR